MIDVSKFKQGQACPSCTERRVYAVDLVRDRWMCVPNAMPVPWRHDQIIEHDAIKDEDERQRVALWTQIIETGQVKGLPMSMTNDMAQHRKVLRGGR